MSLDKTQEDLYNLYLSTYRKLQDKPYTLRKNFEDFQKEHPEDYVSILKLHKLFDTYAHINKKLFLEAPYKLYPDKEFFDLKFYTTMAAMKCYNLYIKQISEQSPDNPSQLQFIKESLLFIRDFCVENKITLDQYLHYKKILTMSWAVHIIEYKISFYVIMGFEYYGKSVTNALYDMPVDEQELLVGDLIRDFDIYKKNLKDSKIAKELIHKGIATINTFIHKELALQNKM